VRVEIERERGWSRLLRVSAIGLATVLLGGCGGSRDSSSATDSSGEESEGDTGGAAPPFHVEVLADSDVISAVWAASASEVWAGGYRFEDSSYQPRVYRFDGSSWASGPVPPHSGVGRFYALPTGELYLSQSCDVFRFDGGGWVPVSQEPPQVDGHCVGIFPLWGTAPDTLWSGDSVHGDMWHWNGVNWSATEVSSAGRVSDIWGSADDDIWAVTAYQVLHSDGINGWQVADPHPDLTEALAVWGYARDDVWLAFEDNVAHYDGDAWTTTELPGRWTHLWGPGPDDVWAAGAGGLAHLEGGAWTTWDFGPEISVIAVHGTSAGDVWAVGARESGDGTRSGIVLRYEP
jgi:hypothetical protein